MLYSQARKRIEDLESRLKEACTAAPYCTFLPSDLFSLFDALREEAQKEIAALKKQKGPVAAPARQTLADPRHLLALLSSNQIVVGRVRAKAPSSAGTKPAAAG